MLKKFAIAVGSLFVVSMVACSGDNVAGGGSIDPNTFASESSSSGEIKTLPVSSAEDVVSSSGTSENNNGLDVTISSSSRLDTPKEESSSSCEDCGNDISPIRFLSSSSLSDQFDAVVTAKNFSLKCAEDVVYVDPEELGTSETPSVSGDVLAPYASKSVAADSVNILISDYFKIPCDKNEANAFVEQANEPGSATLGLAGDTLYVDIARGRSMTYECGCVAQVKFTLNADNSGLKYTVFEQRDAILLEEQK